MNNKKAFFYGISGVAAGITAILHLCNTYVFRKASSAISLNSVWKSRNFGDIAFMESGEGAPLLLVHGIGIGAGSHEWEGNIMELSKSRKVFAIDLPGFGNSEKNNISYNSYYYVRIINEFCEKVIGEKTDVAALNSSCGIVFAAAKLKPQLYGKITAVNPYDIGMGSKYFDNGFVKTLLPTPVIGTFIYNYIASRQSVLSFLDKVVPVSENYGEVKSMMEKQYKNAHRFGANNKYPIISLLNGYMHTPIYELIKSCPVHLNIVISGGSAMPLVGDGEKITITEIKAGEFYPNIYAADEFMRELIK